jgi:hypothetical protein
MACMEYNEADYGFVSSANEEMELGAEFMAELR